jgi:hypothetical protein
MLNNLFRTSNSLKLASDKPSKRTRLRWYLTDAADPITVSYHRFRNYWFDKNRPAFLWDDFRDLCVNSPITLYLKKQFELEALGVEHPPSIVEIHANMELEKTAINEAAARAHYSGNIIRFENE